MFKLFIFFYSLIASPLMYLAFGIGAMFNKKIRDGLKGRIGTLDRLRKFVETLDKHKRIILIHSSSVGEWEQSVQIIKELKKNHSQLVFVATFFSPSGFNVVKADIIDFKCYLPLDDPFSTTNLFKILKPACWVVAKYDLWPNAVNAAVKTKTPIILASAELAEDSTRHKGLLGYFNKLFYSKLDYILPVSEEYSERFKLIYDKPESLIVTGDARYDQIFQKAQAYSTKAPLKLFDNDFPTMICGSTWPEDEAVLFPAFVNLKKGEIPLNIVVVPHEINEKHNAAIESYWLKQGFPCLRYSELEGGQLLKNEILIVDVIGLLAKLYQSADFVYIGGSFSSGVHNVLEPSAFANPVIYGPKYKNSYEAKQLLKIGAGTSVQNAREAEQIIAIYLQKPDQRTKAGIAAREYLATSLGASEKTARIVENFL